MFVLVYILFLYLLITFDEFVSKNTKLQILKDVPRSSYYLNTKVCRYEPTFGKMFDFSAERTLRSIDESLIRLKTDHIDIIQVCRNIII